MNKVLRNLLVTVLVIILILLFLFLIATFPVILFLLFLIFIFFTLYIIVSDYLSRIDDNLEERKREKLFQDYYYNKEEKK